VQITIGAVDPVGRGLEHRRLGSIATALAAQTPTFGARVMFYDPCLPKGTELALGVGGAAMREDLLRQTDTLSVHTLPPPKTRGMLAHAELWLLRPTAVVVSTAWADYRNNLVGNRRGPFQRYPSGPAR
jgi:D-isomer specific 2-hydroxyacid dehydrogenase, NAD binding domain